MDTDINSTDFALAVHSAIKSLDADKMLKKHQQIVVEYAKHRSILVMHEMGSGKTIIAAAALADALKQYNRQVIFMSAKTLHANVQQTIKTYSESRDEPYDITKYNFVTMNASNMLEQLTHVGKSKAELKLEKKMELVSKLDLSDKFLVVDEAHNLFNSITNGSDNALGFYNAVMRAKNLRILFLSGTPIVNHPFELVPAFNMLAGYEVLPSSWDDFNKFFIDEKTNRIKNRAKFQNRISGLVSYYGQFSVEFPDDDATLKKENFPDKLPIEIIKVPMSDYQYSLYDRARDIELKESAGVGTQTAAMQKPKGIFSSSYRRLSRQISNMAMPKESITVEGRKMTFHPNTVPDAAFKDLKNLSPKFQLLIDNVLKMQGKGLIYSSFVENTGIEMIARILEYKGATEYSMLGGAIEWGGASPKYIKITGDIDIDERRELIDRFNAKENMMGTKIKIILISSAGAEGIDLKEIQHQHIVEPYWNWIRVTQVQGRGIRYKSHERLPATMRKVRTLLYLSDYPLKCDSVISKNEKTTDMTLYTNASNLYKLITQFYITLAEASIDCASNNKNTKLHCRLCAPTSEQLYVKDVYKDMLMRSPCKPYEEDTVDAKEILVDDKKYAYYKEKDNVVILEHRDDVDGYVQLARNDPAYPLIYDKVTH